MRRKNRTHLALGLMLMAVIAGTCTVVYQSGSKNVPNEKEFVLNEGDSIDEAITHINTYNTGHSESIITKDYDNALRFQDEIDAAAVYVNASTRFTDGFEFGFGAEIGISTQKLHARGPMGLEALTTTKYIIFGNGQIRG